MWDLEESCKSAWTSRMNSNCLIQFLLMTAFLLPTSSLKANVRHRTENKRLNQLKFRNVASIPPPSSEENDDDDDDDDSLPTKTRGQVQRTKGHQSMQWQHHIESTTSLHKKVPEYFQRFNPVLHDDDSQNEDSTSSTMASVQLTTIPENFILSPTPPAVKYFVQQYNLTLHIQDIATAVYYVNDAFKKMLDTMLRFIQLDKLPWRKYQEPCLPIPKPEADSSDMENAMYPHGSWNEMFNMRDTTASKIIKQLETLAGDDDDDVDDEGSTDYRETKTNTIAAVHPHVIKAALKTFATKGTQQRLRAMTKKLIQMSKSMSQYCNLFMYLVCNPYFKSSDIDNGLSHRDTDLKEKTFGQCDCRPGFKNEADVCVVKTYEDCNLRNMLLSPDLKILPVTVKDQLENPKCSQGRSCVNNLVCNSAASEEQHISYMLISLVIEIITISK